MKTNTLFIIGGVALLGFALWRKKGQNTGNNVAPGTLEQTDPQNNPQTGNGVFTIDPTQGTFVEVKPIINPFGANEILPWVMQGGQPGGGGLLPF